MKNSKKEGYIYICLIGQPGSGKDNLANCLVEKGFTHISTGNIIREEMKKKGLPMDRETMRTFSQGMRKNVGNMYPANIAAERIIGNTVISGPRNAEEIKVFKDKFGDNFILIAINAPIELRYKRVKAGRGRTGDDITFGEFKAQEEAECTSGTHEMLKLLSMANYNIDNSGTKEEMYAQMEHILKLIRN